MKKIFKYAFAALLTGSLVFTSCETIELEQLANPNALSSEQADPVLLLNSVQINYRDVIGTFLNSSEDLTRISVFGNNIYFAGLTGNTLNGTWTALYANMVPDVANIAALNTDGSLNFQEGVGRALVAHSLLLMVDFVGDIPFSQINNPLEFPNPMLDDDADVYAGALAELQIAADLLSGVEEGNGTDLFYDGDVELWIQFINSVRLKAAITTGDLTTFDSIIASEPFIAESSDDMQWQYGTSEVNPDERHPRYAADYTPSGANIYQSNWLMNQMLENNDPRLRYYFTRMNDCTPGATCDPEGDGETLACSLAAPPAHYVGEPFELLFCWVENGYWGRAHGNNQGTPPDNFLRTAAGVYPAGGFFDDDSFRNVDLGLGGAGAGIRPIILASYIDFWRAERAMIAGNTGEALGFMLDGISKSIVKVSGFSSLDTSRDASFEPTGEDIAAFTDSVTEAFNTATSDDARWNILAEQYWVAMYGGGAEAYNFYRRQGFPTTLQTSLEPDPGPFPRTFPYATNEVIANPNISQRGDLNTQVFWDTNGPSSAGGNGFPIAN